MKQVISSLLAAAIVASTFFGIARADDGGIEAVGGAVRALD